MSRISADFTLALGIASVLTLWPNKFREAVSTSPLIPKVEHRKVVYEGYFDVQVEMLSLPHTLQPIPYTSLLCAEEATVVIAETEDGRLVVNKEYRHPSGLWLYGFPGGRLDGGETPLMAGTRELREEAGFEAVSWHYLGTAFSLPAICSQKVHYFFAEKAQQTTAPQKEPLELISTLLMEKKELLEAIRAGAPTDGILLTALSFLTLARQGT